MIERSRIHEGMTVRSADGDKIGKISAISADGFEIERGALFKDRYLASFEDVAREEGDEIYLAAGDFDAMGDTRGEKLERSTQATDGQRMKLHEEELEASRREVPAGEVHLRKEVETEHRTVPVPVRSERVRIEREPVHREVRPGEASFREEEIVVPVTEEEVEIRKRPVVREEVRVAKVEETESRNYDEELKRERAVVETEGDVRKLDDPDRRR